MSWHLMVRLAFISWHNLARLWRNKDNSLMIMLPFSLILQLASHHVFSHKIFNWIGHDSIWSQDQWMMMLWHSRHSELFKGLRELYLVWFIQDSHLNTTAFFHLGTSITAAAILFAGNFCLLGKTTIKIPLWRLSWLLLRWNFCCISSGAGLWIVGYFWILHQAIDYICPKYFIPSKLPRSMTQAKALFMNLGVSNSL